MTKKFVEKIVVLEESVAR